MAAPRNKNTRPHRRQATGDLLALSQAALDGVAEGVCVYDVDNCVVLFNRRYLELFDMSPEVVRPGISYRQVLEHSAARGNFSPEKLERLWPKRLALLNSRKPFSMEQELPSGVVMTLDVRPLSSGGWITVCDDITRRAKLETALRVQTERIEHAVAHMSHGLAMFDADERLIVCNRQYLEAFGFDPKVARPGISLRGLVEHWMSVDSELDLAASELYVERVSEIRGDMSRPAFHTRADGRVIQTISRSLPDGGWVSACEDVTERLRSEDALRRQNLLFDAALENMANGLSVYDRDMRLLVCNGNYLKIYGLAAEEAKPGTHLADLVRAVIRHGVYPADFPTEKLFEDLRQHLSSMKDLTVQRRLCDGRSLAVRYRPLPDGSFVATYDDVTERERAHEELNEQYRRFDAALNNMTQGLLMLDSEFRVIVCNKRYIDMYGLSAEVVKPGTTMREIMERSCVLGNHPTMTAGQLYDDYVEKLGKGGHVQHRQLGDGRIIKLTHSPMEHDGWVITYEDVTEHRKAEARVGHMAQHDALTDLSNRVLFHEKMSGGLAEIAAHGGEMAVLCLDLDNFKTVNDRLGHAVGDQLLRWVAAAFGNVWVKTTPSRGLAATNSRFCNAGFSRNRPNSWPAAWSRSSADLRRSTVISSIPAQVSVLRLRPTTGLIRMS